MAEKFNARLHRRSDRKTIKVFTASTPEQASALLAEYLGLPVGQRSWEGILDAPSLKGKFFEEHFVNLIAEPA